MTLLSAVPIQQQSEQQSEKKRKKKRMDLESEGGAADADALDGVGGVARADEDVGLREGGEE